MIVSSYDEHMNYDAASHDVNNILFAPEACSIDSDVPDSTKHAKVLKSMDTTVL